MFRKKEKKEESNTEGKCPRCHYALSKPHALVCPRCMESLPQAYGCKGCGSCSKN